MELVNVLVMSPMAEESLRRIAGVNPKVRVHDASKMFAFVDGAFVEQPGEFSRETFDDMMAQAEVIYGFLPSPGIIARVARSPKLKWINAPSAGVERYLIPEIVESPVILTNSRGIHGIQVSETVFEMLLMLVKRAPLFFQLKQEKKWQRAVPGILQSRTLGILGLGVIGQEVARLARAFGMKVIALEARRVGQTTDVDAVFPPAQLKDILSQSDFVVVTLPLTPETRNMIGEPELRAMKPEAYLVNVARGGIIDEEALIRALTENWIAGAGLDVFAKEPLPSDSKLWELPNAIIFPHIAGLREDYSLLAVNLFCENLTRYLAGRELINVVDKRIGY